MANIVQQYMREPDSVPIFTLDDQGNLSITGALTASSGGGSFPALNGSHVIYVDGNRTDSYTASGTIALPFKSINAALAQIIANADNGKYVIMIAPGVYSDVISLNNALTNCVIAFTVWSMEAARWSSTVASLTGSITSTSNNNNGQYSFEGFQVSCAITISGASVSFNFTSCAFGGSPFTLTDGTANFFNCTTFNAPTVNGAGTIEYDYCDVRLATYALSGTASLIFEGGKTSSITCTIPSGVGVFIRSGHTDLNSTFTVQSGGTLRLESSYIRGTVTVNAGGICQLRDSGVQTLTGLIVSQGTFGTSQMIMDGTAPTVTTGQVGLGATHAATATAGAATLPANPLGFLIANVEGTAVKIPYYNT